MSVALGLFGFLVDQVSQKQIFVMGVGMPEFLSVPLVSRQRLKMRSQHPLQRPFSLVFTILNVRSSLSNLDGSTRKVGKAFHRPNQSLFTL